MSAESETTVYISAALVNFALAWEKLKKSRKIPEKHRTKMLREMDSIGARYYYNIANSIDASDSVRLLDEESERHLPRGFNRTIRKIVDTYYAADPDLSEIDEWGMRFDLVNKYWVSENDRNIRVTTKYYQESYDLVSYISAGVFYGIFDSGTRWAIEQGPQEPGRNLVVCYGDVFNSDVANKDFGEYGGFCALSTWEKSCGSLGRFEPGFELDPNEPYEIRVNPPFTEDTLVQAVDIMEDILQDFKVAGRCTVIFYGPAWIPSEYHTRLMESPYLTEFTPEKTVANQYNPRKSKSSIIKYPGKVHVYRLASL